MTQLFHPPRGFMTISALVVLAAIGSGVAWQTFSYQLPNPATADREGLFRWMVLRDLSAESPETKDVLVARLTEELRVGVELSQVNSRVNEKRQQRFWRNVDVLLEHWFNNLSDEFDNCETAQRSEWVEQQIDDVLSWEFVRSMRDDYAENGGDTQLLLECEERIGRWRASADADRKQKLNQLTVFVKANLMLRYWRGEL